MAPAAMEPKQALAIMMREDGDILAGVEGAGLTPGGGTKQQGGGLAHATWLESPIECRAESRALDRKD